MLADDNSGKGAGAAGNAGVQIHVLPIYLNLFPKRWHSGTSIVSDIGNGDKMGLLRELPMRIKRIILMLTGY
jgi:hypothetical protein